MTRRFTPPTRFCHCGRGIRGRFTECYVCRGKPQGSQARYGYEHRKLRREWAPLVEAGQVECHARRCLKPSRWIKPGSRWDLGHTPDRSHWTGPEHANCNRSEGAVRGNRMRDHATSTPARPWHSRSWGAGGRSQPGGSG